MNLFSIVSMAAIVNDTVEKALTEGGYGFLIPILNLIDSFMIPLMIVVLSAGTIYAVILGVNMARADSSDARDAAKKRLINCIVGFAIIIVLLAIIYALAAKIDVILDLAETPPETTK